VYLKLVVVCQQLVDFGDKGGIDVQEGSVEVLVEDADSRRATVSVR